MKKYLVVMLAVAVLLIGNLPLTPGAPERVVYQADGNVMELPASPSMSAFHLAQRLLTPPVEAQGSWFRGFQKTFTTQTTTGATASSGLMRGIPLAHAIELIVTGGPATCTYRLQGTRDGTTWFNVSASDITCTSTTVAFESGKPAVSVRGNLLTLTGGTSPTVTLKYIGAN